MAHLNSDPQAIRDVLTQSRVVAVVGHSDNPARDSYQIAQYLREIGFRVYAVNPAVETINGERSYASLADIPEPIDIVSVFRRSDALRDVVAEAVSVNAKNVWAQIGIESQDAIEYAQEAGIDIITNHCIRISCQVLQIDHN